MNNDIWAAVAVVFFLVGINFTLDGYAQKDVRYCQKIGSDEVIIVRAPALCPPGTFAI